MLLLLNVPTKGVGCWKQTPTRDVEEWPRKTKTTRTVFKSGQERDIRALTCHSSLPSSSAGNYRYSFFILQFRSLHL